MEVSTDAVASYLQRRRDALADAHAALARCLDAASQAELNAYEVEQHINEETLSAADPSTSDDDVEAFGLWFRAQRARLMDARRLLENLQAETARERAVLTACRVALERCERRAATERDTTGNGPG